MLVHGNCKLLCDTTFIVKSTESTSSYSIEKVQT